MPTNDRHWFPWITLRPASWRIYYLCPEIRWHLNEISKNGVKIVVYWAIAGIPFLALMGVTMAGSLLSTALHMYAPLDDRSDVINDSRAILSLDEVRRRLGKPPVSKIYGGQNANE